MDQSQKVFTVIGVTSVVALSGIVGFVLFAAPDKNTPAVSNTAGRLNPAASSASQNSSAAQASSSTYRDGTYSASASYNVPEGGSNSLTVSLTITGGKISSLSPNNNYQEPKSAEYIDSFNGAIQSIAAGQSLENFYVSRVGGASLTSETFNNVLDTIRREAQA